MVSSRHAVQALPLLYVNELAGAEALPIDLQREERVRNAIDRVLSRQDSNGSFGLWSVGGDDIWLDAPRRRTADRSIRWRVSTSATGRGWNG